nr:hypothetical protein [Tanacetum cinerariifolium]
MTMHEVVHEMVLGECHEPNSEGSGSAWKAYINARVAGLFLLVLLEYPNSKGVVRVTSRDSIWHYTGRDISLTLEVVQEQDSEQGRFYRAGFCLKGVHEREGCWFIPIGLVGVPQR